MYRILCFGDSNTWGFNPVNGLRFSKKERWPGVLGLSLGAGFKILEDGKNGRRILESCDAFDASLKENHPLDVIIIFLGINDLCFEKNVRLEDLIAGFNSMLKIVRENYYEEPGVMPEIILMGVVPINETQVRDLLYELEAEKILRFVECLRQLADEKSCGFIDTGRIIRSSEYDGIHLEAAEQKKIGLFVGDYVRTFLTNANLHNKKH